MKFSSFYRPLLAATALVAVANPALAETVVTNTWNGAGTFTSNGSTTNSSTFSVGASGNSVVGSMTYTNVGNNPYGYNVPNTSLALSGQVGNGGQILATFDRTGSYTPLYGNAGQQISLGAFSSDGSAAVVMNTSVNYAGLHDLGYGAPRTANNKTIEASGTTIQLDYSVFTGVGANNGGISVVGTGSASLTQNFSSASANGFSVGQGGGIYQLANFSAQGIGTMTTGAVATGSIGIVNSGATIYGTQLNPASVVTTVNYDTTGAGGTQTWNYGITGNAN